jgi:hypothetical protein
LITNRMALLRISFSRHVAAIALMLATFVTGLAIYIGVQASRTEPLPTLVYFPGASDAALMAVGPAVLDRLGRGWWWVYADPVGRNGLRQAGAQLAVAFPTPLAQMAGCSTPNQFE